MIQVGKLDLIDRASESVVGIDGNPAVVFKFKIIYFNNIGLFLFDIKYNGFLILVGIKIVDYKRRTVKSVFGG